ncbi:MAG: beta-glucosidase family protein, partial [Ilumatobacteraceae bacterium]
NDSDSGVGMGTIDEKPDDGPRGDPTPFDVARRDVADGVPVVQAAERVVAAMTDDELLWCLDGDAPMWEGLGFLSKGGYHDAPFIAARVPRVGMPGIAFSDGPRGVVIGNATCFPVSMARGATWDPELEERVGEVIGKELRASGATLFGGVCVNVLRHPAWGRAQETYGEDPFHVGEMGAALTRGVQRHAMATVKHFAANSMENARFRVDVQVDDVALHEVFLPHFRRIVDEGVACVMSAYNQVNGTYCGEHPELLTAILRQEWGFQGFVISDWIYGLRDAVMSLRSGLDIEMPYRMVRAVQLPPVLTGPPSDDEMADVHRIDTDKAGDDRRRDDDTWDDVRKAVTRIVATLLRFDHVLSVAAPGPEIIASPEHVSLARDVAGRSIVLLRNEFVAGTPVLPLATSESLAVIGTLADRVNLGDGGSSDVYSLDNVTVLKGLRAAAPTASIVHHDGSDLGTAMAMAAEADTVIVVVGYTADDEGEFIGDPGVDLRHLFPPGDDEELVNRFRSEPRTVAVRPDHVKGRAGLGFTTGGDRTSLRLRDQDETLIRAVASVNPRTVVIIQSGSAVIMSPWIQQVPAVLQTWYGGQQAGHGVADVLYGAVNPSGRLPFTVPTDPAHLPPFDRDADLAVYDRWHGWWRAEHLGHEPQFPFGFGLSYTTFRIDDVAILSHEQGYRVTCLVSNTGDRDGADVVQVYARFADPSVPRRLVGFRRVEVEAGRSTAVEIDLTVTRLLQRHPTNRTWQMPTDDVELSLTRHGSGLDEILLGAIRGRPQS